MIIKKELTEFDKNMKILTFDTDINNNLIEKKDIPEFAGKEDLAKVLYYTKQLEAERLIKEIIENKISPIKMFLELQTLDVKDLASRVKMSINKVKKHLTPNGFNKIKVKELVKYAKVFDITVSDFFNFITINEGISFNLNEYNKIYQTISVYKK